MKKVDQNAENRPEEPAAPTGDTAAIPTVKEASGEITPQINSNPVVDSKGQIKPEGEDVDLKGAGSAIPLPFIDYLDKIVSMIIAILTSLLVVTDDIFSIIFWVLLISGVAGSILVIRRSRKAYTWKQFAWLLPVIAIFAFGAYFLHDYVTQPRFTMRLSGSNQVITTQRILWFTTPFVDTEVPFEVTSDLIRGRGNASLSKNERDRLNQESVEKTGKPTDLPPFTDVLKIAINPDYKGTKSIQRVLLRITGKNNYQMTKPIWDQISPASLQGEVVITLTEIVDASQIGFFGDTPETSLHLGSHPFPEAEITLEIIDEMRPDKPLSAPIHLKIQNAPWIQRATLVTRDDKNYIDYYLTNLGTEGTFRYQVNIAKLTGAISENSTHPIWSGTTVITSFKNDAEIHLKTGESKQMTIPIRELDKGRYSIEIFTIKQLDRVQIDSPETWRGFRDDFYYANPGNNFLLIDCNDVGKSCYESVTLPVENLSPNVEVFDGRGDSIGGLVKKYDVVSQTVSGELDHISNNYILSYSIDPQKAGYAGIDLFFKQPVDLSTFNRIRLHIQFSNKNTTMMFRLASKNGDQEKKFEVVMGDGTYGNSSTEEQGIEIPTAPFEENEVDLSKISYIAFVAHENDVPTGEMQSFIVGQIEFLR